MAETSYRTLAFLALPRRYGLTPASRRRRATVCCEQCHISANSRREMSSGKRLEVLMEVIVPHLD